MATTILIKFGEFRVHSNPNNMTLTAFPGKVPETGKIFLNFSIRFLMLHLNELMNLAQIQYLESSGKYL